MWGLFLYVEVIRREWDVSVRGGVGFKRRSAGIGRLSSLVRRSVLMKGCHASADLPSVGTLDGACRISQSAMFGTFTSLHRQGLVSSAPNGKCCMAGQGRGVFLLLSRCSPFGGALCGDFIGGLSMSCGMSL